MVLLSLNPHFPRLGADRSGREWTEGRGAPAGGSGRGRHGVGGGPTGARYRPGQTN